MIHLGLYSNNALHANIIILARPRLRKYQDHLPCVTDTPVPLRSPFALKNVSDMIQQVCPAVHSQKRNSLLRTPPIWTGSPACNGSMSRCKCKKPSATMSLFSLQYEQQFDLNDGESELSCAKMIRHLHLEHSGRVSPSRPESGNSVHFRRQVMISRALAVAFAVSSRNKSFGKE